MSRETVRVPVKRVLSSAVLAVAVAVSFSGWKGAEEAQARGSYCSPSGDWCTSAGKRDGVRWLRLITFSQRGTVEFCVSPPRGSTECVSSTLRPRRHGIYLAALRWSRWFPNRGRGKYIVKIYNGGYKVGRSLSFRR